MAPKIKTPSESELLLAEPPEIRQEAVPQIGVDEEPEEGDVEDPEVVQERGFFEEPVYIQRYHFALKYLQNEKWKRYLRRYVDVGANNGQFLFRLRNSGGMRYLREVIALDIDEDVLASGLHRAAPLLTASVSRDLQRPFFACDVYHMVGSIADKDPRLESVDIVVAIEVIEHLNPDTLDRFPEVVFGHMRPKLAVITTPNSEFNVLFPNFIGPFRHWDHKFEFSQSEFQSWALAITANYPEYKVEFHGVGDPPPGEEDHGPCSQIAVFIMTDFESSADRGDFQAREVGSFVDPEMNLVCHHGGLDHPYRIISHQEHPRHEDTRDRDQRVEDSIRNEILNSHLARMSDLEEDPRIYVSDLEYFLESRCRDNYNDPFDLSHEEIRDIMTGRCFEIISSGEDDNGIYFTVKQGYFETDEEDEQPSNLTFSESSAEEEESWVYS